MTQALNLALLANSVDASGDLSLTTGVTGTLPVANGGTGRATLALNNILVGNGTTAVQQIAPGTVGQALVSDGTTWAPGTPSSTVDVQTFNSTGTWTKPLTGQTMAKIQVWGGGGGGSRYTASNATAGGGGGGYNELTVPISFLAGSLTATVGAGGTGATTTANGGAGGQSSFPLATSVNGRSDVSGYGGSGGGTAATQHRGGNAGGPTGAGGTITVAGTSVPGTPLIATGEAAGGSGEILYNGRGGTGSPAPMGGIYHGGGGANAGGLPGSSLYGGGGGGVLSAGTSVWGGAGGQNAAGTAPGGGGGAANTSNTNGSAGAAGRIVVTSW